MFAVFDLLPLTIWINSFLNTYNIYTSKKRRQQKTNLTIFGLKGGLTLHSSNASQSILSLKNGWTRIARSPP